jgi:hypothetical protein
MVTDALSNEVSQTPRKILIVMSQQPLANALQWAAERPWLELAVFSPGGSREELREALARLLAAPSRPGGS